jgi:hypothetical protein
MKTIITAVKEVLTEAAPPKKNLRPGQVVPIPGKGMFKAMNKKGSVKTFTNSAEAGKFATSESFEYADAFAAGLEKYEVSSMKELDETKVSEFLTWVENIWKAGSLLEQGE